jgi:tetratricopeptide (TPR) repeat protein
VTYRTVTYYFDDSVAKAVKEAPAKTAVATPEPKVFTAESVPEPVSREVEGTGILSVRFREAQGSSSETDSSPEISENPPTLVLAKKETPAPAVATPAAAPAPASTNPAMDLYQTGRNRFEAGDVKGAIDAYLESVKLEPNSAEVFLNLGHAYLKLDKNSDAIKAFKQSIKLNPDQAESQYGLGIACFRSGRNREAADAFKKATTLNPSMAKAHYGLSLAYGELGETNKLMDEYRILERLDKSLAKKVAQTFPEHDYSCRLVRGCP